MKKEPRMFVNPFSENFLVTWDLWKDYKWESFKFKYKGVISEQMAIKHLVDLSEGEEERAVKIIQQSIRRQWQGFFPLHETTSPNGKPRKTSTSTGQDGSSLRDRVLKAYNKKRGDGESGGDITHLKAV